MVLRVRLITPTMKKYLPYTILICVLALIVGVSYHYSQEHLRKEFIRSIPYTPPHPVSIDFGELVPLTTEPRPQTDAELLTEAQNTSNTDLCAQISNETTKTTCIENTSYSRALTQNDKSLCAQAGSNQELCQQQYEIQDGLRKRTTATCRNLVSALRDQCYGEVEQHFFSEGDAICRSHARIPDQQSCQQRYDAFVAQRETNRDSFQQQYNHALAQANQGTIGACNRVTSFYGLAAWCRIQVQRTTTSSETPVEERCAPLPDTNSDVLINPDTMEVRYMNEQEACRTALGTS